MLGRRSAAHAECLWPLLKQGVDGLRRGRLLAHSGRRGRHALLRRLPPARATASGPAMLPGYAPSSTVRSHATRGATAALPSHTYVHRQV
jgi:hypothetical protein